MSSEIIVKRDLEELSEAAADFFVETARTAIDKNGRFTVALAGGSTPKSLYKLLASETRIDWPRVVFFFGDERNVLHDSPDSNFRMAKETLFDALSIPDSNVFAWNTEISEPEAIADDYREKLKGNPVATAPGSDLFPKIDLVLLGMGPDGHTASLFPYTSALDETERSAVANYVEKLDSWRLTLTYPVINNAFNIAFLVSGGEKAEALKNVLDGEYDFHRFPAQGVKPTNGRLIWFVDAAACFAT
ncbi:MAG TPA: 6-phosphogluconolactonase [Pyrinomonadaceae bacterium]|jgi:6-phosphogluconolactonase|nr:6-phosphogluconolactonase [Pyrinomonadaceae bacterium]